MKPSLRLVILAVIILLAGSTVVYALVSRSQTLTYSVTPNTTVAFTSTVPLGALAGGQTYSKTISAALTVTTKTTGTHTITMTLTINSSDFSSFSASFDGGNCLLTLASKSCSFTFMGATTYISDETLQYTAMDGTSDSNGQATITMGVS
ncbi:MAG: hypothetical protein KGI38_12095 [Thaumarchaeota archaeon]|nr:hypothetical protein [Nitrososphaerota archaeon]